jgi:uncharacterized protein (DUF2235 family)
MPRRLVVCCDGTWKAAEAKAPTNIVFISRSVLPVGRDDVSQPVFYDPGVGTGTLVDRISGGAFGRGLSDNIKDAYRWLIYNYSAGDQIYVFGFSRGAYTARSLVGLIRKCWLLHKPHADLLPEAYRIYRLRDDTADSEEAGEFRVKHCRQIDVHFLGVFDTVGALGVPLAGLRGLTLRRYRFHDPRLSSIVKHAYHAVAIDERRKPFRPTLWETRPGITQTVEQVWFTGVHSDVGGGYPERGLSDVALRWMIDRAGHAGLDFDERYLGTLLEADPLGVLHNSKTGLYRFTGTYDRPIGVDPSGCEAVSSSAVERHQHAAAEYRPENLVAYLQRAARRLVTV